MLYVELKDVSHTTVTWWLGEFMVCAMKRTVYKDIKLHRKLYKYSFIRRVWI